VVRLRWLWAVGYPAQQSEDPLAGLFAAAKNGDQQDQGDDRWDGDVHDGQADADRRVQVAYGSLCA